MIIAETTKSVEKIYTSERDGAAYLPSRGCGICTFDARYAIEPLDSCATCDEALDGHEPMCGARAAGAVLYAELLAEADQFVEMVAGLDEQLAARVVLACSGGDVLSSASCEPVA